MHSPPGARLESWVQKLAGDISRAQGPSQALLAAASAITERVHTLVFVGLAVMARDRQSIRMHVLYTSQQGAARLGAVAASSSAAGIAMDTKQVVHVRDLLQGDLGLQDLQYLVQEHQARTCLAAPLVVDHNALGALSLGASQPLAFDGQEAWLQVVAAMCAPYLALLRSHQELMSLEGLVSQMVPVRVALHLQDQQRRSVSLQAAQSIERQRQPPAAAAATAGDDAAPPEASAKAGAGPHPHSDVAISPAQAAAAAVAEHEAALDEPDDMDDGFQSSALRQLRARKARQQQQHQQQQAVTGHHPASPQQQQQPHLQRQQQHLQEVPPQQRQQLQARSAAPHQWDLTFGFQQQRLEHAYQLWACRQWQRWLDGVFFLLILLSAAGSSLGKSFAGSADTNRQQLPIGKLPDNAAAFAVLLLLALLLLHKLHRCPAERYLRWRVVGVALLRVLRAALFCCEVWQLQSRPSAAAGTHQAVHISSATASRPEVAACGILVMLGLLGQLPVLWHAAVQLLCVGAVTAALAWQQLPLLTLGARGDESACADVAAHLMFKLLVLAWLVPVAVVALVEWVSRECFLRRIM